MKRDPLELLGATNGTDHKVTAPTVQQHGDDFTVEWAEHGVELAFTGIREGSDGLHAEVSIRRDGEEVHWSRLGLLSDRSRDGIIKRLERSLLATDGAPVPWPTMVDKAARVVADAVRRGEPAAPIHPRPITGLRFLVDPLMPLGQPTIVYADGGTGKSTLALILAVAIATHSKLPVVDVCQSVPVMFADYESSEPVIAELVYLIERGLGVSCGERLLYRRMVRPLIAEAPALRAEIARAGVGLFILDSTGPAAHDDPASAGAALATMTSLRSLGPITTLAVAHVSAAGADQRAARPYGSVYYANIARSCWEVRRTSEDTDDDLLLALYHRKVNHGRLRAPLSLRVHFAADRITLHPSTLADAPDLMARATYRQRIKAMLATGKLTTEELAEALDNAPVTTIRKTLERMRDKYHEVVSLPTAKPSDPLLWGLVHHE
jgi:AAA domain